tara:strand:+ start:491 stop:619 length:129 start_codon:yes stop_codon:yes gene_type:complete
LKINLENKFNEKTFRDSDSGFKDFCPIDYETTRARPEHRDRF